MKKQGMTDREVIASVTSGAAKMLGMESRIGRFAPGYSADIIAVGENAHAAVTVLEEVDFVMVRGRVIECGGGEPPRRAMPSSAMRCRARIGENG